MVCPFRSVKFDYLKTIRLNPKEFFSVYHFKTHIVGKL